MGGFLLKKPKCRSPGLPPALFKGGENVSKGEKKPVFVELRAAGLSLSAISSKIGVSKSTLSKWGKELSSDVEAMKDSSEEELREKLSLGRKSRLARLGILLRDVEEELARRDLGSLSITSLFRAYMSLLDQLRSETQSLDIQSPVLDIWKHCLQVVDDGGSQTEIDEILSKGNGG